MLKYDLLYLKTFSTNFYLLFQKNITERSLKYDEYLASCQQDEIIFKAEIQNKTVEILNLKDQNKKNNESLNQLKSVLNERIND